MFKTFSWYELAIKVVEKKKMPQSGFEPLHADWHSLGGTELNHETIWKVAWL